MAGFTLMEIMAAVFMLGVLLLPLLTVKERAASRVERAHARLRALVHAENMLSEARLDPRERLQQEGRVEGDEDFYRYRFTLEDWDTSTGLADDEDEQDPASIFGENAPPDAGIAPETGEEEDDPHKVRRFELEIFWPHFEHADQEDSIKLEGFLPRVPEERDAVFNR